MTGVQTCALPIYPAEYPLVEGVPVVELLLHGVGGAVVVDVYEAGYEVLDDLSHEDCIAIPPSAKSLVMFFFGLDSGISSTQL